jgi:hypothetical protein
MKSKTGSREIEPYRRHFVSSSSSEVESAFFLDRILSPSMSMIAAEKPILVVTHI